MQDDRIIFSEVKPAVGEPAEVAKALVAAAKNGQFVVRLVAGDVLTADPVVKELQSVSRSAVLFDVIPGLSATAVASSPIFGAKVAVSSKRPSGAGR